MKQMGDVTSEFSLCGIQYGKQFWFFFFPQAVIINTPLFLLYQYILSGNCSEPKVGHTGDNGCSHPDR